MYIDVDYNPTPSDTFFTFFISVGLNDKEAISFDYTIKGQRITKQVLTEKKEVGTGSSEMEKPTSEWDVIELKDGKFLNKRHVKWVDKGEIDEVEGEVWKTEWAKPMSDEVKEKMLQFSRLVSDNYKHLEDFSKEMSEFEEYAEDLIEQYK
jgi:hypothetical protein